MSSSIFKTTVTNKLKRNAFNLSHERKFSLNMGQLVPILCEEVVPGDSWKIRTEMLMRMAPLVAPMMHRVDCYTHFFFVPNRLIWDDWQDFITGGEDGDSNPVMPYRALDDDIWLPGYLGDYLGYQTSEDSVELGRTLAVSALPFRAYDLIWNEYYRDQNLQDPVTISTASGEDTTTNDQMLYRCWQKDYFTAALPWTQKGDEVVLPLGTTAPIEYNGQTNPEMRMRDAQTGDETWYSELSGTPSYYGNINYNDIVFRDGGSTEYFVIDPSQYLEADLASATGATINDLRAALHVQKWLERNARAGSRYTEYVLAHFGVRSSDARLQRPEFLGGGRTPVTVSEVLQTSETSETSPQGNMGGHGISVGTSHEAEKFFEEHGYIIGIMSVMPRTAYCQGLRRHLLKTDKFDYYHPEFAYLGEQEVLLNELYVQAGAEIDDEDVFGYQPRYSEYKYIPDTIHGSFKESPLDTWHMARIFDSEPALNADFVSSDDITHNIFADTDTDTHKLYVQLYHDIRAIRPMPVFTEPGI